MSDRRGFALVATLWLLVVLGAIGLEFGLRARAQRLGIANRVEGTRALAAAVGGLEETRARLSLRLARAQDLRTSDPEAILDPWAQPQRLFADSVRIGAVVVRVRLRDAGDALHLNTATEEELRRLFAALRFDVGQADRLAQAILDWRDADDLHRGRGAEAAEYARQALPMRPANRPFARLSELRAVLGMTPALYDRIRPYLTVRGSGRINVNAAPRPVLLALAGMSEEAVDGLSDRRNIGRPIRRFEDLALELSDAPRALLLEHLVSLQNRAVFETRDVVVTSEGSPDGSPVTARIQSHLARAGAEAVVVWTGRDP